MPACRPSPTASFAAGRGTWISYQLGGIEWAEGVFAPLRYVPPEKLVVLGLVTSKRGELERKDELKRRIEEASRYIAVEQLCLSPQCGFSSTVDGNALTLEQEIAKLELVVETAAEVWG
jgi:5-methyltetrahydropteroyltriglutamate--homocysteine methyltransferase